MEHINQGAKRQIDEMTYEEMLKRWRFAPMGDPMFQGNIGKYFAKVLAEKRDQMPEKDKIAISKKIGWG